MAIDRLQEKIRKMKNPTVLNLSFLPEHIPQTIMQVSGSYIKAREIYCKELLEQLKESVPAVRFSFASFALDGAEGLESLQLLLQTAKNLGYYVFLDGPEALSAQEAGRTADILLSEDCCWYFDGLILCSYIGSDGIKPYVSKLKTVGRDLFVVARTANRSATELQDLLTGTRLMHMANADIANRFTQPCDTKSGYSRVGVLAAASSAESLRTLRTTYKDIFLLIDGCDYPNANAKNCSNAFDLLGHGAAACVGLSVIAAWQESEQNDGNYLNSAFEAAIRMKKNLTRYITIL